MRQTYIFQTVILTDSNIRAGESKRDLIQPLRQEIGLECIRKPVRSIPDESN